MTNEMNYRNLGSPQVLSIEERYPHLARSKTSARVDHRSDAPPVDQAAQYRDINTPKSRGPITERRFITNEEVNASIARRAEKAAQQAISPETVASMQVDLAAVLAALANLTAEVRTLRAEQVELRAEVTALTDAAGSVT